MNTSQHKFGVLFFQQNKIKKKKNSGKKRFIPEILSYLKYY